MSGEIKQATPEAKKPSAITPALGFVLALALGGIAFFAAPLIVDALEGVSQFEESTADFDDEEMQLFTVAIGVMLWFLTFSILITLVAAVAGKRTVIEEEQATLHPRMDQMNAREARKYEAKIAQQRKKKIEALKKLKREEEAKRRRGESS
jgi:uncharacterized membrane protein (DUF106 family)